MLIFISMLLTGLLLGFVGAGGSGFIIAILITIFHIPVLTALATSIAAMVFTMLSGSISHLREGNAKLQTGLLVGLFGAAGSYLGTLIARQIPPDHLVIYSASMLFISAIVMWYRTRMKKDKYSESAVPDSHIVFGLKAAVVGLTTGLASGTFGIGATPLIQLGLIILMGMSLRHSAGTTMLVILPIALSGAIGYYQTGYLDFTLLLKVVAGTMIGSYIGAKFTSIVPTPVLRLAMISVPIMGGTVMLLS